MKFILFFLLSLISLTGFAQYPTNQSFGSPSTLTTFKGAAKVDFGFIHGWYADTTTANATGYIKFHPGAQILTGSLMTAWYRNLTATEWILGAPASATPTLQQTMTAGSTLTGNNTIQGGGFAYNHLNSRIFLSSPSNNYIDFEDAVTGNMTLGANAGDLILSSNDSIKAINTLYTDEIYIALTKRLRLGSNTGDLSGPLNGDMFYNSTTNKFRGYENGSWVNMIGSGSPLVDSLGTAGVDIVVPRNDSLLHRLLNGVTYILVDTIANGSARVRLDTADAGLKAYITAYGTGGTGTTETASSGLYKTGNDIRLGVNPLLAHTEIPTSPFYFKMTSSTSNAGTIAGVNTADVPGVSGTGNTGFGTYGSSTGHYGAGGITTNGPAGIWGGCSTR